MSGIACLSSLRGDSGNEPLAGGQDECSVSMGLEGIRGHVYETACRERNESSTGAVNTDGVALGHVMHMLFRNGGGELYPRYRDAAVCHKYAA